MRPFQGGDKRGGCHVPPFSSLCLCVSVAIALFIVTVDTAQAFYEYRGEETSLDVRGFVGLAAAHAQNPSPSLLYKNSTDQNYSASARLLALGNAGEYIGFEFNGYAFTYASTAAIPQSPGVERSSALEWTLTDRARERSRAAIDHLNLRLSRDTLDITVGRQAISLATCFFFTPNDFFAPFSAQTFYRVFKPGVDSARLSIRLGELSQLTLVSALGYQTDASSANGYAGGPDGDRATNLVRASTTLANFEWAFLAGRVRNTDVLGGSIQGELFDWLGVRAEGHHAYFQGRQYTEFAAGVERRFENGLTVRYEQFHHGSGYGSTAQYPPATSSYLGMNYGALGLSYQFTPLWNGEMAAITNYTDGSGLAALYGVYSLADEAELALGLNLPAGEKSPGPAIKSEYGLAPATASLDLRVYF